ncbi:glycosyltransferase [Nitrosospira briensis]|uniref:glycosyltransferase n=1 Tax=Nitrosospira briensis TaxID=35799 RepID=UPI0012E0E6A6|nr:glycosyltransferase family 4 protein [Nitrosospira briensis]
MEGKYLLSNSKNILMKGWKLRRFTRSIWFNKLSRQAYKNLPLPWHIKQWIKKIYLRQPDAWGMLQKDIRKPGTTREALQQVAASAKQFDPGDPWVLVVDSWLAGTDQRVSSIRLSVILCLLREIGFRITFVSDSEKHLAHHQTAMEKDGINVLHGFDVARSHLEQTGGKYHFVLLSGPEVTFRYLPYVRAYALYSKVIYDAVDLHWIRFEREMQISGDRVLLDAITQFRRVELYNTARTDLVLAVTDEEKARLLIEQPDAKVNVLPNIYDILPPKTPFRQRRGLLFSGDFWHKSDEDAVTFFVQDIFPRITEKIPDLVFYIIGSNISASIESLRSTNVEPLGAVPDITPYFESCRIFVAPLRFGTGMKSEAGHSLSHGLPSVATRIGAEGMDLCHEKHLLIADNPEDFADMVIRLYNDEALWRRLSAESLIHLTTNYSLAAARERMIRIFARTQDESSQGECHENNTAIPACSANESL